MRKTAKTFRAFPRFLKFFVRAIKAQTEVFSGKKEKGQAKIISAHPQNFIAILIFVNRFSIASV
jgi:hypothetical protein